MNPVLNFLRSYWFVVIAAVLLILVLVDGCNKAVDSFSSGPGQKKFPPREFSVQRINDSQTIYRQAVQIKELRAALITMDELLEQARKAGVKRADRVAKIDLNNRIVSEAKSDRDVIVLDSLPSLPLPAKFESGDRYYSMHAIIDTSGRMTVDVSSYGSATVIWGDTVRGGFFNKILRIKDPTLTVVIDNPNLNVAGLDNISLKKRKRFYERPSVIALSSFLVGFIVSMK